MRDGSWRKRLLKRLRLRASWVIFFVLGLIMLNFPFIHIFNKPVDVGGIPLFFLYLQGGWLLSIVVIWLFVRSLNLPEDDDREDRP